MASAQEGSLLAKTVLRCDMVCDAIYKMQRECAQRPTDRSSGAVMQVLSGLLPLAERAHMTACGAQLEAEL